MRCSKCSNIIPDNSVFCSHCGFKVDEPLKRVALRCSECSGTLEIDSDRTILSCPYCGSKELIVESDAVTIERIKAKAKVDRENIRTSANKDIEFERIRSNERIHDKDIKIKEREIRNQERERKLMRKLQRRNRNVQIDLSFEEEAQAKKFRKGFFSKFLMFCFIFSCLLAVLNYTIGYYGSAVVSTLQAIIYAAAWLMGVKVIRGRFSNMYGLVSVLGIMLCIPFLGLLGGPDPAEKIEEMDWNEVIFMSDLIPEPVSRKYDIHSNTDSDLWVDVLDTSEAEYFKYIKQSKELGYVNGSNENSLGYEAYNDSGYKIDIYYYKSKKEMRIDVDSPSQMSKINWNTHNLSNVLPEPLSSDGLFRYERDDEVSVIIGNTTSEDYLGYLDKCINNGFNIDAEKSNERYNAYNANGYRVYLSHNPGNKEMSIELHYPRNYTEWKLPLTGVGVLLPGSKKASGCVVSDYGWAYTVYIENMDRDNYEKYVEKCIKAGFDKDVRNYEDSYWADYKKDDDIGISVSCEGFNIVKISVTGKVTNDYSKYTN